MSGHWRGLSSDELESIYNPRVAAADAQGSLERFARSSEQARAQIVGKHRVDEDLRYANGPLATMDLYRPGLHAAQPTPLIIFIHGGYWRALDKADHSFVVPPVLQAGGAVANVNYDLCPAITLDAMVVQIIEAVRYCMERLDRWQIDPQRVVLVGHSAGAHLAARVLNERADSQGLPSQGVAGVVAISGIYEPELVLNLSVNEQVQLDLPTAQRNNCLDQSPQNLPDTALRDPEQAVQLAVWAGGLEPEGWIDQSTRYAQTVRRAGLRCENHVVAGTDHFSVLERSFETNTPEFDLICQLANLRAV